MASEIAALRPTRRRRYSAELKAEVLAQCDAPGASVAKVAMSHGINANVVHHWRQLAREGGTRVALPRNEFVPLPLTATATASADVDIRIELRRGPTALTIHWPVSAGAECAAWLRELLR
jgi:transposase